MRRETAALLSCDNDKRNPPFFFCFLFVQIDTDLLKCYLRYSAWTGTQITPQRQRKSERAEET